MAKRFNELGIPSIALTDESKKDERAEAKKRLTSKEIIEQNGAYILNTTLDNNNYTYDAERLLQ